METSTTQETSPVLNVPVLPQTNPEPSPAASTLVEDERRQVKALLAEARATKEMIEDFEKAIQNGTYQGYQMLAVAKGLAFINAIVAQNKAHIANLQDRLGAK